MTVITLSKLIVALAIALRPLAPPNSYSIVFSNGAFVGGLLLLVSLAAYVDVVLGFLTLSLVVSAALHNKY